MSSISIHEVISKKDFKEFVKFQIQLYKGNPYFVPPIIADEVSNFDASVNPVFEIASARLFMAKKNGKPAGRIAAIINSYEVEKQNIKKMRFGWYDTIDDLEVSKKLLEKVEEIGKENKLEYIEGPVGFNNLDKTGVLTEGFDHLGTMITWYHNPYQKEHLEQLGFIKEKEYLENKFLFKNVDQKYYRRIGAIIKKRFGLESKTFTKTKDILPYVDEMFELFSKTYSRLSSYVPKIGRAHV